LQSRDRINNYIIRAILILKLFLKSLRYRRLLNGVDLIHVPDSSMEFVSLAYVISRILNRKLVITFQLVPRYLKEIAVDEDIGLFRSAIRHYLYVKSEGILLSLVKSLVLWLYVNIIKRSFAIVLNKHDYDILSKKYGVITFISWNGISKPNVRHLNYDKYRIVYIGRDERKGLKDIMSVIPLIINEKPKVNFVLIGPELDLPNTISYGFVSERTKWFLLCSSGLFVSPTYHDSFSLVIAEALSCGLPVITYDLPELRAIYGGCKSVFFVKKGDINALKDAIIRLLNVNENEYVKLREEAMMCSNRFDWIDVTRRELEIYRDILRST
ncbi:MAG: glycosyltransferase, partial [Vulcanisaeta sp.]